MIAAELAETQPLIERIGRWIGVNAEDGHGIRAILFRPKGSRPHDPACNTLTALVRQNLDRVDHRDVIVDGGEPCACGFFVPTGEDACFGLGTGHHIEPFGANAALGPNLGHNCQRLPNGKGGDARDRSVCQRRGCGDVTVNRINDPVSSRFQKRVQCLIGIPDHEKRALVKAAHACFSAADIRVRHGGNGSCSTDPFAAPCPVPQHPWPDTMQIGGGPSVVDSVVKSRRCRHTGNCASSAARAAAICA
mmetsp:Transcript_23039/g.39078  ORF Transcript_23039/g.39078 Transcript_23039/m.39078 type:complete len:249 (+) Transcript_23039:205-951(+)